MCLLAFAGAALSAELPVGSMLCVRLTEPLASDHSRPGELVQGVLAVPVVQDGRVILPARTPVTGRVAAVRKVGLGIKRDRATLELAFREIQPYNREPIPIEARVVGIENAREQVARDGKIRGTSAAEVPQVFFTLRAYQLPLLMPVHPIRLARLTAFPFFPQPEIRLPRGSDIWIEIRRAVAVPDGQEIPQASMELAVSRIPQHVTSKKGKPADRVNLAVVGTREELDQAFERAGWDQAQQPGWRSVFRAARNVFAQRYDPYQPMSRMMLNGRFPDRQYQRGLNTYGKRHHLRAWELDEQVDGKPVWAVAATHDIGVKFLWNRFQFTHSIDPKIDVERAKVAADLAFSGCIADSALLDRDAAKGRMRIQTDGMLMAIRLKPCEHERTGSAKELLAQYDWRIGFWKRMLQRQFLIIRNDAYRLNGLWAGAKLGRHAVMAMVRKGRQWNPAETMIMPSTRWSPGTEKVLSTSIVNVPVSSFSATGSLSSVNAPAVP